LTARFQAPPGAPHSWPAPAPEAAARPCTIREREGDRERDRQTERERARARAREGGREEGGREGGGREGGRTAPAAREPVAVCVRCTIYRASACSEKTPDLQLRVRVTTAVRPCWHFRCGATMLGARRGVVLIR
jgi:hypothetical protein